MKKFFGIVFMALCFSCIGLYAQDDELDGREQSRNFPYKHTFGLAGSSISGSGLFYKLAITPQDYVKVAGFAYSSETTEENGTPENSFLYNAGAEYQRALFSTRTTRFYALGGINFGALNDEYTYAGYGSTSGYSRTEDYSFVQYGLGLGFEIVVWKHLSLNLDVSYNRNHVTEKTVYTGNYPYESNSNRKTVSMGIGGGIGIGYTF